MEKYRAIPEGYMKVGELAKRAGVTVRTLQYYDKEGLLSPSGSSDGGFRLYTDRDAVRLFHILTLKQSGFTLDDIRKRLVPLDTPADAVAALTEHAAETRGKIEFLSKCLAEIEALKAEIERMEAVDFNKFALILMNLQMKNRHYWVVKHFDDDDLAKFGRIMSMEKAAELMEISNGLFDEALALKRKGASPDSEKAQALAKKFWDAMMEMTGGDTALLQKLNEMGGKSRSAENLGEDYVTAQHFMGLAMEIYFGNRGEAREGD